MSERDIFIAALHKDDPAERSAYLDEACAGDAALRQRLEALLRAHAGATGDAVPDESADADAPGGRVGPYRLLQQIGEGGMGVVWMAEQREPIRRMVALKVIKPGMDSAQVIARFEAERQALALMDHPNIARVFDAGTTDTGRPYFVMELVKGIPITRYCDEQRLTPRQRLELFVPVCQAIQHAHQKGVIHRDVKPSNVLVASYDGRPVPKVIDFGVAKAMGRQLTERTLFTGFGGLVGTLEYMSPEQAEFNALDIDTRSDVYSLGVLLYELLTGTTPLTKQRLQRAAVAEVLRLIREEEPPKPSTRLSESKDSLASISAQRQTEPAKLARLVSGELDWIVMRALEKDRGRRYETANGFAQDVQRYLADEPVQAGPPSARYRLRKFVRRNRGRVIVAGLLLTALVVGSAGTTLGLIEARRQRDQADGARQNESAERLRAEDRLARLYVSNGARHLDEGDWLGSLPWFAEALRVEQADSERAEVHRRRLGVLLRQCPRLLQVWGPGARSAALSPDGRHVALWSGGDFSGQLEVRDLFTGEALPLTLAEKQFLSAWFSPDGRHLVTSAQNDVGATVLQIHDTATGKALPLLVRGASNGQVSPDGRRLVTTGSVKGVWDKQEVRLWDLATGAEQTPPALRALVPTRVVLGSGGRFATMTGTEEASRVEIQVWATATGAAVGPPIKPSLGADDVANQIIRDDTGRRSHFWPRLAFRPDGARLAASYAKRARVWDVATGQPVTPLLPHDEHLIGLHFSHDGSRLLTAAGRKVFVWDATTGARLHDYPAWTAQYGFDLPGGPSVEPRPSPDDRCVLLDTAYQTFLKDRQSPRVWDLGANGWTGPTMTHAHRVVSAEYTPDARRLFTINRNIFDEVGGEARLWDLLPARRSALDLQCWGRTDACLSPDGRRVVVDTGQGLQVHDLASGRPVSPILAGENAVPGFRKWPYEASCMAFSGDGRFLFVIRPDQGPERRHFQARVYEVATGAAVGQPVLLGVMGLSGAAVSPDGSRFLLVGAPNRPGGVSMTVQLWDTQTGQAVATLSDFEKDRIGPIEATFSPDGRLVVGLFYYQAPGKHEATGTVRLWDAATGRPAPLSPTLPADRLRSFGYRIDLFPDLRLKHLAFSPDGRRLALTVGGNRAYLCSLGDDAPPAVLEHHQDVNFVGFSPDGNRVATASSDLTARVWDAATGAPATPPLEHEKPVVSAAFQADGRLLATVADDHSLRVWDVRTGAPVTPPLPGGNEQVALSPDGHRLLTFLRRPGGPIGSEGVFWDLTPDARPVDDLILLAQLLSGHHIDSSGALVPLDAQARRDAWEKLRARYPRDFGLSEEALLAWHREEASSAEGRGDWAAVVFHVGRLLRADPGQVALLLRRGKAHAQLGLHEAALTDFAEAVRLRPEDWNGWAGRAAAHASLKHDEQAVADWAQVIQRSADNLEAWFHRGEARARLGRYAEADADFVRVIELQEAEVRKNRGAWHILSRGSPDLEVWYDRALVHLARGDAAGYRQTCETFLGHFRNSMNDEVVGRVAWACALAPDAVKDLAEAERMVQQPLRWETEQARQAREREQAAAPAKQAEPDHLTTAGALAYRRGNFQQAVTLLVETRKQYGTEGSAWDWLFLAMAHRRLGHEDEARQWLRRAVEWIDRAGDEPSWERRLELRVLRREAEALVNGAPAGRKD